VTFKALIAKSFAPASPVRYPQTYPMEQLDISKRNFALSIAAAPVLEEFGDVIADSGSAVVIPSRSGHRLPDLSVEENRLLPATPVEELLSLPML
jgi:hypothetical protein